MTRPLRLLLTGLCAAAITATALDAYAYLALVSTGVVREANPVVAALSTSVALWAKAALAVLLVSLAVLSRLVASRALRFTVGLVLVVAIVTGLTGAISTVGAA